MNGNLLSCCGLGEVTHKEIIQLGKTIKSALGLQSKSEAAMKETRASTSFKVN